MHSQAEGLHKGAEKGPILFPFLPYLIPNSYPGNSPQSGLGSPPRRGTDPHLPGAGILHIECILHIEFSTFHSIIFQDLE